MNPDTAICRWLMYSNSEGLNSWIWVFPTFTSFGPIPSSRKLLVKFRMKKITA